MKTRMATIFTPTMTLFAPALSRIPRTRITVRIITTKKPGTLNQEPVRSSESLKTGLLMLDGSRNPKPPRRLST